MDEFAKTMEHWPSWLMFAFICFAFVGQLLDKVFKFLGAQNKKRRADDGDRMPTHSDIYRELGKGAQIMEGIKQDLVELKSDLIEHMQNDTRAQNSILDSLNQMRDRMDNQQ